MQTFRKLLVVSCFVGSLGPAANGVDFEWLPVDATGSVDCMPGNGNCGSNQIILDGGGQTVMLHYMMSAWDPTGAVDLGSYQITVESDGYLGVNANPSNPGVDLIPVGQPNNGFQGAFMAMKVCTLPDYGCAPGEQDLLGECATGGDCDSGPPLELCMDRCDHVYYQLDSTCTISTATINYSWSCASTDCALDPDGTTKFYGATLLLEVPAGAVGTYTVGFVDDENYTLATTCPGPSFGLNLTPALITILCTTDQQCDDGDACTDDVCDGNGFCQSTLNYNPAVDCCDPVTGVTTTIDDGNECTDNICNTDGTVKHPPLIGNPCGGAPAICHLQSTCDAQAQCMPNFLPAGTVCGGPPSGECDAQDECNGQGTCEDLLQPVGTACGDQSESDCDHANTCSPTGSCLNNREPQGTPCEDGDFCTVNDQCDRRGGCDAGPDNLCDDGVGCTDDSCDEGNNVCINTPNDANCADTLYCNGAETCDANLDCQPGTPVDCDDSVGCTNDSCNEGADSCDNIVNDAKCDDDLYCNGEETCDPSLDCQPGTPVDCDDSVGCTDDSCNENTDSCDNIANDANCDDTLYCTGVETCDANLDCQDGADVDCDDDNDCTEDLCDEDINECVHNPWPAPTPCGDFTDTDCDNPDTCDGNGTCLDNLELPGTACGDQSDTDCDDPNTCDGAGTCDPNNEPDGPAGPGLCDDGNQCTQDNCLGGACDNPDEPNGSVCNDDLYCTVTDTCNNGLCTGTGNPCAGPDGDGNCAETCDEANNNCLANDPNGSGCDNGLYCDGTETCTDGQCGGSTGDPCAGADGDADCAETCDEANDDCLGDDPNGSACNDGNFCNGTETCTDGACGGSTGNPCPGVDGDANCAETCDEGNDNCLGNDPNGSACDDGEYCTGTETCTDGACGDSTGDPCDGADGDGNCAESCNEANDNCSANDPNGSGCDNGQFCDGTETCTDGACGDSTGDPCDGSDGDDDCAETCDEANNDCLGDDPNGSACDDGSYCNGTETCTQGLCGGSTGNPCPGADGDGNCAESCDEGNDDCLGFDPNGSACTDQLFCTGTETCSNGVCGNSTGDPCDGADGDANCAETCDEALDDCLANDPDGSTCTGNGVGDCTAADTCLAGVCEDNDSPDGKAGPGLCDDDNDCTNDVCDTGSCTNPAEPNGTACGDGDDTDCTDPDTCNGAGFCDPNHEPLGTACGDDTDTDCDNPDTCNGSGGCLDNLEPDGTTCDDGLYCNVDEECTAGVCGGGTGRDCGDGVGCTNDSCDEENDVCVITPNDTKCNNGDWCDGVEICHLTQDCIVQAGSVPDCDDGVDCTNDSCDEGNDVCVNAPNDTKCNNGLWCDGVEVCDPADDCVVTPGSVPDCDDQIGCTVDTCDDDNDVCVNTADDGLCPDDGLFCNGTESCDPNTDCTHSGCPCGFDCEVSCDEENDTCLCEAPLAEAFGSRYLRITPRPVDSTAPQGIIVTPDCPTGISRYVGAPEPFDIDHDGTDDGSVAFLVDDPADGVFLTPAEWGTVYVTGAYLPPETTHVVQGDCGSPGNPSPSESATATTWMWADVTDDGYVNVTDVQRLKFGFQLDFSLRTIPELDIWGGGQDIEGLCTPQQIINVSDIQQCTLAIVRGVGSYPQTGCPFDCPLCSPPACGNGRCEPGEDCAGCASDCREQTSGNPDDRYCCDGDLSDCGDVQCDQGGWVCGLQDGC